MTKRTIATNWDVVSKDTTGAFGSLDYNCPYCHYDNYEMIFIGTKNIDKIANDFELEYREVSALTGENIDNLFVDMAKYCYRYSFIFL